MTTAPRRDPSPTGPAEDERLARWLGGVYAAPPMTEARRRRFDARLEARLGAARRTRPWEALLATATAALALVLWAEHDTVPAPVDASVRAAAAASADAVLALATDPVADSEEALPIEYRAISSLLLDAPGGTPQ